MRIGVYKKDHSLSRVIDCDESGRLTEPLTLAEDESNTLWIEFDAAQPAEPVLASYFAVVMACRGTGQPDAGQRHP